MPDPAESIRPSTTKEVLCCLECGRGWIDESERWRLYLTADTPGQLLLYCTICATREFD